MSKSKTSPRVNFSGASLSLILILSPCDAAKTPLKVPYVAVVMNAASGEILASYNPYLLVRPASLTKMMTLYCIFERLKKAQSSGIFHLKSLWTVSRQASLKPPTIWGVTAGKRISVQECILGLAVRSGNDVAQVALDNMPSLLQTMNERAKFLGMNRSSFCGPSGWDTPGQYTCAYDMALLIGAIWRSFPEYACFLGVEKVKKGKRFLRNTNKLQGVVEGMKMGKTGFTNKAGSCLATLTQRNTPQGLKTVIVVVMGMPSSSSRNAQVKNLIETAYQAPENLKAVILNPLGKSSSTPARRLPSVLSHDQKIPLLSRETMKSSPKKQTPHRVGKKKRDRQSHQGGKRRVLPKSLGGAPSSF